MQNEVTVCAYAKVTPQILPDSKAVFSFNGKLADNREIRCSVRPKVTLVWSAQSEVETSSCDTVNILSGTAQLDKVDLEQENGSSAICLMDPEAQVDSYLERTKMLCDQLEAQEVVGEPDIFILYQRPPSTFEYSSPVHHINSAEHPWGANTASYIGEHLNYHEHR